MSFREHVSSLRDLDCGMGMRIICCSSAPPSGEVVHGPNCAGVEKRSGAMGASFLMKHLPTPDLDSQKPNFKIRRDLQRWHA